MNDIIAFITRDAYAGRTTAPWRVGLALSSMLIPFAVAAMTGFRGALPSFFVTTSLPALTVLIVVLGAVPFLVSRAVLYRRFTQLTLTAGITLALSSVLFRTDGSVSSETLAMHFACFAIGIGTSGVTFLTQFSILRIFGPLPDLATRLTLAVTSGLSGLLALELHCPSHDLFHLVFSHLGHSLLVIPIALWILQKNVEMRMGQVNKMAQFYIWQ